jgi:hypothetical protein
VIARDISAFQTLHPDVENVIGNFHFSLPASGGTIRLLDHRDTIIREVHYLDSLPWPMVADGGGRTLEYIENATDESLATNWFAGCMFGSPGQAYQPCSEEIIISEINYASIPTANSGDWFEIRNTGSTTRDLSGWRLRDDNWLTPYTLPEGTLLDAGASIVVCTSTDLFDAIHNNVPNRFGNMPFALSSEGEIIRVYDAADKLSFSVYYQTQTPWPTSANEGGYTLEWNANTTDVNSSDTWFEGCILGSPGTIFIPCDTTSVSNVANTNDISVYPIPASDRLYVQFPFAGDFTLKLYNMNGSLVKEEKVSRTSLARINTHSLNQGIYILQINQDNQQWNQRIIVSE